MKKQIQLNKEIYSKPQYERVIDTSFNQLGVVTESEDLPLPTVDEFFQFYNDLFFQIPKTGFNSHETLITTSTEYVGNTQQLAEIKALQEEITDLRRQLLESKTDAINTIADVLDETGINIPELPEIPDIEIPSEFKVTFDSTPSPTQEETKREIRKRKREERREQRRNN